MRRSALEGEGMCRDCET